MKLFRNHNNGVVRMFVVREPGDNPQESWVGIGESYIPGWRCWHPSDSLLPHGCSECKALLLDREQRLSR